MKTIEITSTNGFLNLEDLPQNCIFNKVVTGCGGTTIALNNTKLKTDAGAFTFNDVSWDIVKGTPDNNVLSGVDGIENEVNVSLEVTKYYPRAGGSGSGAVSKTITNLNNTHIRITLGVQALYQQLTDEDRSGDIIGATISYNITIIHNYSITIR